MRVRYLNKYPSSFCAQYVPLALSIMLTCSVEGKIMPNFKFQKSCSSFCLVLLFFLGEGRGVMAKYGAESAPLKAAIRPAT